MLRVASVRLRTERSHLLREQLPDDLPELGDPMLVRTGATASSGG